VIKWSTRCNQTRPARRQDGSLIGDTDDVKGTNRFTSAQADQIRALLRKRAVVDRSEQKRLRDGLRAIGFYISDWSGPGLGPSDFDALARSGQIKITDASRATRSPSLAPAQPRRVSTPAPSSRSAAAKVQSAAPAAAVPAARASLTAPRHSLAEAAAHVPGMPGLYAIYGDVGVWQQLKLGDPPDDRPLYIGKAEDSLVSRDLRTHFGSGRTGSSTVRRSFAALLRDTLDLHAQPRNPSRPERFSNYGLRGDGDERLTRWMREHLRLAVWQRPTDVVLIDVERSLLAAWQPPLNLKDVHTPWSGQLSAARKVMAAEARAWVQRQ
jgi:hypothetical protein